MRPETEKSIEKYLAKRVGDLGGLTFKFTSPSMRGVPDRIVILNRRVSFVEVKAPDGTLSKLQQTTIDKLTSYGVRVAVVYSKASVDVLLEGKSKKATATGTAAAVPKPRGRPRKRAAEDTFLD